MQVAKYRKVPSKLNRIAKKIAKKYVSERKRYGKIIFHTVDKKRLAIEFFSSILKTLSNKRGRNILNQIKEGKYKATSQDTYYLNRLQKHGLVQEKEAVFFLTEYGERMVNSLARLSPYIEHANKGEQNVVLLYLLSIGEELSFSQIAEKVDLNPGSLSRALNNLLSIGLISKNESGKYEVEKPSSLSPLKDLCSKFQEIEKGNIWIEDKEPRFDLSSLKFTIPVSCKRHYSSLEDVIDDHVVVTYSYESERKKEEIVNKMIFEQIRRRDGEAKPVRSEDLGKIKIAYEIDNIASLQHFLNRFCLHAIGDFKGLLVEHMEIPNSFWKKFEYLRPRYGIEGIRKLLGIERTPLLHVIIPPYLKTQDTVDFVQTLFSAGVDAVGDHQFIGLTLKEFEERIEGVVSAIENLSQESSHKMLYYPYIEGETFLEKLDIAKHVRSKYLGLGLSPITFGIPSTIFVRRNYTFPLHLHLTLHAIYTRMGQSYLSEKGFKSGHGFHINTILKLFALCGGDEVNVDCPFLYFFSSESVKIQCDILRTFNVFPVLVGGITLNKLGGAIMNYGNDMVIKIGGEKFLKVEEMELSILRKDRIKAFIAAYKELLRDPLKKSKKIEKWSHIEERIKRDLTTLLI